MQNSWSERGDTFSWTQGGREARGQTDGTYPGPIVFWVQVLKDQCGGYGNGTGHGAQAFDQTARPERC
jgi:hypothetical protein